MFLAVFTICAVIFSVNGCLQLINVENVVFSAVITADGIFQRDEIVKFDSVVTNIGNSYNKNTGIFTAPKTGLYVFHINGLSSPGNGFWFILYHNRVPLYRAHGRSTDNYISGGNSIALRVKSGETVYVKSYNPSTVHGTDIYRYCSFTGYLIAAEADK